jgi:hypothetical protein
VGQERKAHEDKVRKSFYTIFNGNLNLFQREGEDEKNIGICNLFYVCRSGKHFCSNKLYFRKAHI